MVKQKNVDMLSGNIAKGLLLITLPIMAMNIMNSLFHIVDMTILKAGDSAGGSMSVGAVGVCGTLITLITCWVTGISVGANVVVAKYIGKKKTQLVLESVGTGLAFAVIGGLALVVIGLLFAEIFLGWINCPDELMKDAALYFRTYFLGMPFFMIYTFGSAIARSEGDGKTNMNYAIVSGILKICLTYVFVIVFKLSIIGVSIATIISWIVPSALYIIHFIKSETVVKFQLKFFKINWPIFKEMVAIGLPTGVQNALYSVANAVISSVVNSFGAAATTGISIANTFDGLLYQISISPSMAVIPYVSQNMGAGNFKRVRKTITNGIFVTVAFGLTFGILSAIFSAELSSIMSDVPEVIAYSQQKMILISSTYFICGIQEIYGGALKGLGKAIAHTITTLVFMCGLRFVWVYFIFPLFPKDHALTYLYLVWPVGWVLSVITLLIMFIFTIKKLEKTYGAKEEKQPLKAV